MAEMGQSRRERSGPRVRATTNGLFLPVAGAPPEPLGQRIIEMPEQPEATELARDPRSGFVAYVRLAQSRKAKRSSRRAATPDRSLHGVPWHGSEGHDDGPRHRRPIGELHRAAACDMQQYAPDENHEGGRCQADRRGHDQHHGLRVIARYTASMNMSVVHGPSSRRNARRSRPSVSRP